MRNDEGKRMSLSDEVKTALENNGTLMALLTGGLHNNVEEISRQNTPGAFDSTTKEIMPCALIKYGTDTRLKSGLANSVNSPLTIYFYQRQGYAVIEAAMDLVFTLMSENKIGTSVWNIEFDIAVNQQRDTALDCALGSLRFVAKRRR
jgi:hypothetical protein